MRISRKTLLTLTAGLFIVPVLFLAKARGSDHADTPAIAQSPGVDLTDVFVFPSPNNSANVVLAMNVHPLIPSGQSAGVSFDPDALYQFKIDNNGDNVEDLVIQAKFVGTGPTQKVFIYGPSAPVRTGTVTQLLPSALPTSGTINATFAPTTGVQAFAGAREDPFFFDLDQFFTIFPDRATPITGTPVANPNTPQATTWRSVGLARDFLAGLNLLSVVVELPKSQLAGSGNGKIGVWCTTSK